MAELDMAGPDRWVGLADGHEVWERTTGGGTVRERTVALVEHLATLRRRSLAELAGDPWQDPGFAARMTRQVQRLLPPGAAVPAAEAALLVAVPFLHDTLWSGLAARARSVGPHDLAARPDAPADRGAFERFAHSYPRLRRRATLAASATLAGTTLAAGAGRPDGPGHLTRAGAGPHRGEAAAQIGWWLLHRWVGRQPAAYEPASVAELLVGSDPGSGLLDPGLVAELLRALRADPGFLARTGRADAGVLRVGYLLAAAAAMAVETVALPEVVVEHLGIADPVCLPELRATVTAARWRPRGGSLVLDAECGHPAVEVALRSHVETLNRLLSEAQRAGAADTGPAVTSGDTGAGQAMASGPGPAVASGDTGPGPEPAAEGPLLTVTHASADGLRPAADGGAPAYQSAGVRFRLAEERVQELLMGEQLYGDPALAIRELYQNALDACRYRQARTEYLWRTRDLTTGWQGSIRFEQGTDADGRPYLDCVDNGVGMGVRELGEVFSQAGVRLADLPEFVEEQAEWARLEPPVRLFPNSRFGIGVLSYFMLADEITVDTCRLGRDGEPGDRLRVSIAGPGNLFRIRNLGPGGDAGTTIRLHLRADGAGVSCVETLRTVLWVADFHTEAVHGTERLTWQPGELSPAAPVGDAGGSDDGDREPPAVVPAAGSRVWWCPDDGGILADGLWAGESTFGVVVNLSRELAPQLSVDRTKILSYREEDVDRLLQEAVPAVSTPDSPVLTTTWLYSLTSARPTIADAILDWALAAGHRHWDARGGSVDVAIAGCFPPDRGFPDGPDQIVAWRLTALAAAGRYRGLVAPTPDWAERVVRARPSDALLLSVDLDASHPWLDPAEPVRRVHLLRAAHRLGRDVGEVADRLRLLGYALEDGYDTMGAHPDDLVLTSRDLDGSRPWLDPAEPVSPPHLLRAAHRTGRGVREIAARLTQVGFTVAIDLDAVDLDHPEPDDLVVTSRDLDGGSPWLDFTEPVPLTHLVRAAKRTGRTPAGVAARLAALGYQIAVDPDAVGLDDADLVLISRNLDAAKPWLDPGEAVQPLHLVRAAGTSGRPVRDVAARLGALGHPIAGGSDTVVAITVDRVDSDDTLLVSRDLDGVAPWLDAAEPVPLGHLFRAADDTGRPVDEVARRLAALGYTIRIGHDIIGADPDDRALVSRDLDESAPWLEAKDPVPVPHLIRAAQRTRRPIGDVAARLAALGYPVHVDAVAAIDLDRIGPDDFVLASRDVDGVGPWLGTAEPVPLPHLLRAAQRTRRTVAEAAARLAALGYLVVSLDGVDVSHVDPDDLVLTSRDLDGTQPWLDAAEPVPLGHLFRAARRTRRTLTEVAERLAAMGYTVGDVDGSLPRFRPGG